MVWFIPAAISAVLLLRGHRMITVVGGLIGGLAGFIASDILFNAVPMLLEWELQVKIGLIILGFGLVYTALIAVMRSVAGIGVYIAVSSLVFTLSDYGYEIEQNHSNILGAGLAVGAFLLTWNMRRAMPLLASLIVGASLGVASFQLFHGATLSQIDPVRPEPLWLWILFICFGLLIQRIDIKKRRHLKEVEQGTIYDPKLSEEKHFKEPKKKGLDKYMEAEPWHQK